MENAPKTKTTKTSTSKLAAASLCKREKHKKKNIWIARRHEEEPQCCPPPPPTDQHHMMGCISHSKKENGLAGHFSRNLFQEKTFTLSTTSSTEVEPPTKIISFRQSQLDHTTTYQTKVKPRHTRIPTLEPRK